MTLRLVARLREIRHYTWSKSIDNISVDGNGYTSPMDTYNIRLNRMRGDADRPHVLNYSVIYTLPIGRKHRLGGQLPGWANNLVGGWDVGLLGIWESGSVFTVTSGRRLTGGGVNSYANYTGDRNIGKVTRKGDGVYYFTPEQIAAFSFPGAGEIGNSGRNAFRGPRFFKMDISLVKKFRIREGHSINFRAEAYNMWNQANFGNPGTSLGTLASLGKISGIVNEARIVQMALRYEF
jgi:hypothetical protein